VPTYEYACSSCDTTHEIIQAMTDSTLTDCPACNEPSLKKRFNGVGVVFKGSGFYRTDSRKSESASSTASSNSSTSSATSSSAPASTSTSAPASKPASTSSSGSSGSSSASSS
jgi:putative FmdB family regulatory protein